MIKEIKSALLSVYHKEGLDEIIPLLRQHNIEVYSTGGTQKLLEDHGMTVYSVESLTGYPSILDGRVKTLHPKVFGGILAKREENHLDQLAKFDIPEFDLVVVDLYPFEQTVRETDDESQIIEKIDIGGISLIRAAAKNFKDVVVIASQAQYADLKNILDQGATTQLSTRKRLASLAFGVSSHYDTAIYAYFNEEIGDQSSLKLSVDAGVPLRYGENPHQSAMYYGDLREIFDIYGGKELSYNNLVDIDAAVDLMSEFVDHRVCFAIFKHTNSCGVALRKSTLEAYSAALAGDPVSAFGGILITNSIVDEATAIEIDKQFYEVLIAEDYSVEALKVLLKKKKRIILRQKQQVPARKKIKTLLGGYIGQDPDTKIELESDLTTTTNRKPSSEELEALLFANKCAKHLKSNVIVLVKDNQLIGMGCGQTSRVDACIQAIDKAKRMGFSVEGAVMASDAFFPFADCVEIAQKEGVTAVIHPGGSINDQLSIDFCNEHDMAMVLTGIRHFKH